MSEPKGIVSLYKDCVNAIASTKKRVKNPHDDTILSRISPDISSHTVTLENIRAHLQDSRYHVKGESNTGNKVSAGIDDLLEQKLPKIIATARTVESTLVSEVISFLSNTQIILLQSMTTHEIMKLIQTSSTQEEVDAIIKTCKAELRKESELRNGLSKKYKKASTMSENDLKAQLVEMRYEKDRKLNKFEQKTNKEVIKLVEARLDNEWKNHLKTIPQLKLDLDQKESVVAQWEERLKTMEQLLKIDLDIRPTPTKVDDNPNEQSVKVDESLLDKSIPAEGSHGSRSTRDQTTDVINVHNNPSCPPTDVDLEAAAQTLIKLSFDPNSEDDDNYHDARSTITSTFPHTNQTQLNVEPMTIPSPSPSNDDQLDIFQDGPTTSRTSIDYVKIAMPEEEVDKPLIVEQKEVFKHDYEHNRESSPAVSPAVSDKAVWGTAFAGLDKYARNLFSSGSKTGSPRMSDHQG